jgi:hypothetical protein
MRLRRTVEAMPFARVPCEASAILLAGGPRDASATSRQRRRDGRTTGGAGRSRREMALTKDFKETVQARARRDPAFRQALLQEALATMLEGDLETEGRAARLHQRDDRLRGTRPRTGTPAQSLMRMFGPRGDPQASNLFAVLGYLQRHGGFHLEVRAVRRPSTSVGSPIRQRSQSDHCRHQASERLMLTEVRRGPPRPVLRYSCQSNTPTTTSAR